MVYNEIGKTGMQVSNLSLGASSLGGVFHGIREEEGIRAVHVAVDNGINFIDVSPYYGHLKAETVLGKALKEIPRDKYYLSTKVGRYGKDGTNTWDYSAKRATESVYESMQRLNVDYIDGTTTQMARATYGDGWVTVDVQSDTARQVRRVYGYVRKKAAERRHNILLGVRVAPTPAGARAKGCDVGMWVREGWVDWVCASTYWETPDYNMPVAEWREWFGCRADSVMLLAGTDHGLASTRWNQGGIRLDMEMKYYAGFADVQWGNGVDGLYLFNIPYLGAELKEVCRLGLFPQDLPAQVRSYPVSYRSDAWGGSPDDLQLARKSDRPNEFKVRLGANPSGEASVVLGTVEPGEFNPEVTLNAVASTGSDVSVMKIRPKGVFHKGVDYYCRRYRFPSGAVHGGAGNVVRVGATDEPKTIVWCEIVLEPPAPPPGEG